MTDKRETDYELTIAFNSDDTLVVMKGHCRTDIRKFQT